MDQQALDKSLKHMSPKCARIIRQKLKDNDEAKENMISTIQNIKIPVKVSGESQ